jgi:hypothetical protein
MWRKSSVSDTVELGGGMNTTDSALKVHPGILLACQGFEIDSSRGYTSAKGFERYDGRTRPSEAAFYRLTGTNSGLEVGDTLTGEVSEATGQILAVTDTDVYVFLLGDTEFLEDEAAVGPSGSITITDSKRNDADSLAEEKTYRSLAMEAARALIDIVPGSGPVRGVWQYKGVVYAFRDNEDASACEMHKSTKSGWMLVPTPHLDPGGSYEFVNYNFGGHSGTLKMYGVDGKNKAFEFDGEKYLAITTGMAVDKPTHIMAHHNHLFLAFPGGSVQHSPIADPTGEWSVVTGAAELGMGDDVVGMLPTPGGVAMIWCRNSTKILNGSSSADWTLDTYSDSHGAIPGSLQNTSLPTFVGDEGLGLIAPSEKYGDFVSENIDEPVQKIVRAYKDLIINSVAMRHKSQYRLFFSTGDILVLTFKNGKVNGYTWLSYPVIPSCVSSSMRSDRYLTDTAVEKDHVFFGSESGFVYQLDAGPSFDGDPMACFFTLPPFRGRYRGNRKLVFRSIIVEVETESGAPVELYFKPDYSLFDILAPEGQTKEIITGARGGRWNINDWNQFFWDAQGSDQYYEQRLDGTGYGVSLTFGKYSGFDEAITIKSITFRYGQRGEKR